MNRWLAFGLILVCLSLDVLGQGLPRNLTDYERTQMTQYLEEVQAQSRFSPPPQGSHIRSIAEWEELKGIAISWVHYYRDILKQIVDHASREGTVYIHCEDEAFVRNYLSEEGIDLSEDVEFIETDYNSIWIRDYGPNSVYLDGADSLVFIDWIYNRPRPQDDEIPSVIGQELDIPVIETNQAPNDLVHTGGNYFTDGQGMAFSSKLVLQENGPGNEWGMSNHDISDIERIMRDYMGIEEYAFFDNLSYDIIHHIDMHMKLIDEETLLVGEYPPGVADGPQIEANLQYLLSNFKTVYDREFDIIRIPMPPDGNDQYPDQFGDYRTYTNAVFVNKTVLVPTYEERYDTTALDIWREMLPGHKIIGINSNLIIPQAGAIHCITKEIGVKRPIWIRHKKLRSSDIEGLFEVPLKVKVQSPLDIDSISLHYSFSANEYHQRPMTVLSGDSIWMRNLSIPQDRDSLYYYFSAHASTGKTVYHPLPGKPGAIRLSIPSMTNSEEPVQADGPDLKVYPNPASAITCIEVELDRKTNAQIGLFDSMGRLVKSWNRVQGNGKERLFFNAGKYPPGMYILHCLSNNESLSHRILIDH